jgi:hypothetical protein
MDNYLRNRRRLALIEPATFTPERIRSPRALQHLKEGFNRRVLMLEASFRFLIRKAGEAGGKPVSPYTATELALHLNAFYLNLCGALDNLAWALQYEHNLVPGADEAGAKRQQVNLFSRPFLEALGNPAPSLVPKIREHVAWNTDLRDLRDPAVHRIPIYAVPAVADQQQGEQFKQLQQEAARLFESGDYDGGMELIFKSQSVGTYEPLMVLSDESAYTVRGIVGQIGKDDETFVSVSDAVLGHLFRP